MDQKSSEICVELFKTTFKRFCIVVVFGIAFGYIEAAVVVYLRTIFHPDGFTFPLVNFGVSALWERLLLTEIGREGATLVLILTGAWLFGRNRQQRFAYFLTIFAVWDIFYYVWLKVLIDWPASVMDWDILFLMPTTWAGPVLAPVLVSVTLLAFAVIILSRLCSGRTIEPSLTVWFGFVVAGIVVVVSFCVAGGHVREADFQSHFYWPLFGVGLISAIALFLKCLSKSESA
jgi:hypothetical protein